MKKDRFLIGIVVAIGALVVVTVVLFLIHQQKQSYIPDNTPSGVVHDYTLAVLNHDYEKAYGYLADLEYKPTYQDFYKSFQNSSPDSVAVEIGGTTLKGADTAVVTLYVINTDYGSSGSGGSDEAELALQLGAWKLTKMVSSLWDYSWYQEPYNR